MKRVVITGMGINSCIGNTLEDVTHSLQNGISGTRFNPTYEELNFKSHVSAAAEQNFDGIDRKLKRFMGVCAMYAYNSATSPLGVTSSTYNTRLMSVDVPLSALVT